MTYNGFLEMIKDRAQERLGKLYNVSIENCWMGMRRPAHKDFSSCISEGISI